mmetsp:Transcript_50627/g.133844  ORF Transcript_50627/g.133844 Transcript_50627/m.133844 type:complete len:302 (-) Transcript_50627:219-1124(-)
MLRKLRVQFITAVQLLKQIIVHRLRHDARALCSELPLVLTIGRRLLLSLRRLLRFRRITAFPSASISGSFSSSVVSSLSSSIRTAAASPDGFSDTNFQSFRRPIMAARAQSSCGAYRVPVAYGSDPVATGRLSARRQPSHAQARRRTAMTGCIPVELRGHRHDLGRVADVGLRVRQEFALHRVRVRAPLAIHRGGLQEPVLEDAAVPVRFVLPVPRHFEHLVDGHVEFAGEFAKQARDDRSTLARVQLGIGLSHSHFNGHGVLRPVLGLDLRPLHFVQFLRVVHDQGDVARRDALSLNAHA